MTNEHGKKIGEKGGKLVGWRVNGVHNGPQHNARLVDSWDTIDTRHHFLGGDNMFLVGIITGGPYYQGLTINLGIGVTRNDSMAIGVREESMHFGM